MTGRSKEDSTKSVKEKATRQTEGTATEESEQNTDNRHSSIASISHHSLQRARSFTES